MKINPSNIPMFSIVDMVKQFIAFQIVTTFNNIMWAHKSIKGTFSFFLRAIATEDSFIKLSGLTFLTHGQPVFEQHHQSRFQRCQPENNEITYCPRKIFLLADPYRNETQDTKSPVDISLHHLMLFSNQAPCGQFQHPVHTAHRIFPMFGDM